MARLNLLELENGLENGFGLTNSQLHLIYNLLHYAEKRCISTTKISSLPKMINMGPDSYGNDSPESQ